MALRPQFLGYHQRFNTQSSPPLLFFGSPMHLAVMRAAQRHREFVADLAAQCLHLRKFQVVRIGWLAAAQQAGLCGDKLQVRFVATTRRVTDCQRAAVRSGQGWCVVALLRLSLAAAAGRVRCEPRGSPKGSPIWASLTSSAVSMSRACSDVNVFLIGMMRLAHAAAASNEPIAATSTSNSSRCRVDASRSNVTIGFGWFRLAVCSVQRG